MELLVSAFVLSIAIIGVALMIGHAQTYFAVEVDDRIGVGLAREKIEALRRLGFDCIPVADGNDAMPGVPEALGGATSSDPTCTDVAETQAARTYHEDEADQPAGAPANRLGLYERRVTVVTCVDQASFPSGQALDQIAFGPSCTAPVAKKVSVELTPRLDLARAIRVEALFTLH